MGRRGDTHSWPLDTEIESDYKQAYKPARMCIQVHSHTQKVLLAKGLAHILIYDQRANVPTYSTHS